MGIEDQDYIGHSDLADIPYEEAPTSGGGFVKEFAVGMAKFQIGLMALKGGTKFISKGIFKGLNKRLARSIASKVGVTGARTAGISSLAEKIGTRGMVKGAAKHLAGSNVKGLSSAAQMAMEFNKSAKATYGAMQTSGVLGAKRLASMGKHLYKQMPAYASFYAVERGLGMLSGDEHGKPALYNVPGTAVDFAKSALSYAAFDGVTGAGKIAFKGITRGAKAAVSSYNIKDNPLLHKIADKYIPRHLGDGNSSNMQARAFSMVARISQGQAYAKEAKARFNSSVGNLFSKKIEAQAASYHHSSFRARDWWKKTHDASKAEGQREYKNVMSMYRDPHNNVKDFINLGNDLVSKTKGLSNLNAGEVNDIFTGAASGTPLSRSFWDGANKFMHDRSASAKKESFFGRLLGRTHAKTRDLLTASEVSSHRQRFANLRKVTSADAQKSLGLAEEAFLDMRVGRNVYKGHSSTGIVDYSSYQPLNMLNSVTNAFDSVLTFGIPGSSYDMKPISIIKGLVGMQKTGRKAYAFGTDEEHFFKGVVDGHGFDGYTSTSAGELGGSKGIKGLAGVYLNGDLYVGTGGVELAKVGGANSKFSLFEATAFSRHSHIARMSATPIQDTNKILDMQSRLSKARQEVPNAGMVEKIITSGANFLDRRGLGLPPLVKSLGNKAMDSLGIGPKRGIFKSQMEILLQTSPEKLERTEVAQLLNKVFNMSESASRDIHFTLSDPKMLRTMASLSSKSGKGKNVGNVFNKLADYMGSGHQDKRLIDIAKGTVSKINDGDMSKIIKAWDGGNRNLSGPVGSGARPNARILNKRQELVRKVIRNEMTDIAGMSGDASSDMGYNIAEAILENSTFKHMPASAKRDLKLISLADDLWNKGSHRLEKPFSSQSPVVGGNKQTAFEALKKFHTSNRNVLEERMAMHHNKGGFNSFIEKAFGNEYYDKKLRGRVGSEFAVDPFAVTNSPYIISDQGQGMKHRVSYFFDRMMEIGNFMGLKYGTNERFTSSRMSINLPENTPILSSYFGKDMGVDLGSGVKQAFRRVKQVIGLGAALQATDAFSDALPILNGTIFDEGLYAGAADVAMKASLAFHKVKDITGVTEASKYLEGLAPGSTTSVPGAFIGGALGGPLGIPLGMIANRLLEPGLPNLDTSYDEQKEILSGRELVPIRRARWWTFGKESYSGGAPKYFRPHWLAKAKSQYKYTDTLYGSKAEALIYAPLPFAGINPIGHFIDKYHYDKKHYMDRPYPRTGAAFEDVPFIGGLLGATVGRLPLIGKPSKNMHEEEMAHYYDKESAGSTDSRSNSTNMPLFGSEEQKAFMGQAFDHNNTARLATRGGNAPVRPMNPYAPGIILGQQAYNTSEVMGLGGFVSESFASELFGQGHPFDKATRYSTTKEMMSTRRQYWDMQLGDVMFTQEFIRRFVPKEKAVWSKKNPLRNRMSGFLPGSDHYIDFLTGDPFTSIPEGEIRLPGDAYQSLYDVKHSFPGAAGRLGRSLGENVRHMLGLDEAFSMDTEDILEKGTEMHRVMQENLSVANLVVKNEQLVYDAENDIAGYIDVVMRDPSSRAGKRAVEIKTINSKGFAKLVKGPKQTHVSQINFYIKMLQAGNVGTLIYINRDNPEEVKTFEVKYSERRWRNDLKNLQKSREIASGKVANGEGFQDGSSYSWFDRFRILADVAPYSDQYKTADRIVQTQLKRGALTEDEKLAIIKIKKNRASVVRRYELYPNRFKGRVFNPDIEYETLNQNKNIKAAAEYSVAERAIGSIWERFTHLNTPVNTKFFNYRTPLEHYQRTRLYGTECLHPETIILISDGSYKFIKDINEGDFIVDYKGDKHEVLNKDPKIKQRGQLIDIKITGSHDKITCTKDHNMLSYINDSIRDIKASQLQVGDYVPYPKFKNPIVQEYIDLAIVNHDTNNIRIDDNYVQIERSKHKVNRYIPINEDLGIIIGWYLAEGYIKYNDTQQGKTVSGVAFCLSTDEMNELYKLKRIMESLFKVECTINFKKDSKNVQLTCYSKAVGLLIKKLCGEYSISKKLPLAIMSLDVCKGIAYGIVMGDGHIDFKDHIISVVSINKNILEALKYTMTSLNIFGSIQKRNGVEDHYINGVKCKTKDSYALRYSGKSYELLANILNINDKYTCKCDRKNYIIKENFILLKINSINDSMYEGCVYDITTNGSSTFTTNICSVHNSSYWSRPWSDYAKPAGMQALAADNPVDGAVGFGWLGYVLGGGKAAGSLLAGTAGLAKGAASTIIGRDDVWIPETVRKQRNIEKTFDELKYRRAMNLYDLTGEEKYMSEAENTMWAIRSKGYDVADGTAMRAMSKFEKPYFKAWSSVRNKSERQAIKQSVPEDIAMLLEGQWRRTDGMLDNPVNKRRQMVRDKIIPVSNFIGYGKDDELRSLKIKTIRNEGLNEHDWGLGWYDQQKAIDDSPYSLNPIDLSNRQEAIGIQNVDPNAIRSAIISAISPLASNVRVSITALPGGTTSNVQINMTRDRRSEIQSLVRGY